MFWYFLCQSIASISCWTKSRIAADVLQLPRSLRVHISGCVYFLINWKGNFHLTHQAQMAKTMKACHWICCYLLSWRHDMAPVPLSIFRSNSKFDENSKHSSVKYSRPITTIFCTRHDSVTVVTCAKYRCDRSSIFETRAFWIFIECRIRSKCA